MKRCRNGWALHEDIEQKLSQNVSYPQNDEKMQTDVKTIDWGEAILCNSMGISRLIRHCDDKSLNILLNPTLFSEKWENYNIVSTHNSFVELSSINKNETNGKNVYNFQEKSLTEMRNCTYGFPDSLFSTQILNEEKYDTIPNDKKTQQIFSARGMFTTSLYTKKWIRDFGYWTFCRQCDTTFDFSTHSPGDYKNILINSKLLFIIAWDAKISPRFHLSFRRLKGGYSRRFTSQWTTPLRNKYGQLKDSNVNVTEFGISLRNCDIFGLPRAGAGAGTAGTGTGAPHQPSVSLADLSSVEFDCVLLDSGFAGDNNNSKNIIVTLILVCKALPHASYCFEFVKITVTFSHDYKNLVSCWCQRDTNVAINDNLSVKKMLDVNSECVFGWNNKTAGFNAQCVKIESSMVGDKSLIRYSRLLVIVIKSASHHIILYNYDLNNFVILKLNSIVNIKSNKIFPYVCN